MAEGFARPNRLSFEGNVAENWRRFKQNYEIYIVAAGHSRKTKKEKSCILLNLAGEDAVEKYNSFTFNEEEDKDDPEILKQKFEEICMPLRNLTFERHLFHTRKQGPSESISSFVTDLKNIARKCEFGDLESELIKDRIVCGINSDAVRRILLREANLTLEKALTICSANELSEQQVKDLGNHQDVDEVDSLRSYKRFRSKNTKSKQTKKPDFREQSSVARNNCRNCGGKHLPKQCPAFGKTCYNCGKKNHFGRVCLKMRQSTKRPVYEINDEELFIGAVDASTPTQTPTQTSGTKREYKVQHTSTKVESLLKVEAIESRNDEWHSTIKVGEYLVKLKLDTGAKCNVLPKNLFDKITQGRREVTKTNVKLISYSGDSVQTVGQAVLECVYKDSKYRLLFHIAQKDVKPILGLPDCERMGMVKRIIDVNPVVSNVDVFNDYPDLFDGKLGCLPVQYHITLNPSVKPIVDPPRRVPVAMRIKIKDELDRMQQIGVIEPVQKPTEWVSSMVTVEKPNKLRICIDPRHLNEAVQREYYPLLTIEEVVSRLSEAKYFSVFDAASGFWQIPLDESSSYLTTFNTPFGRYKFNRLPFGISSAPEVFQRVMHQMFDRIDGCEIIMDDILVWGATEQEHDERVVNVLNRAREINLKLKKEKTKVKVTSVDYMGHKITSDGLKADPEKVRAILQMPTPKDKKDLQRFLGMVQYLAKFIPHLSELASPLRVLLKKESEWCWFEQHQEAYEKVKRACGEQPVLRYYDVSKEVTLSVDASMSGLGAVCLQEGQPVAYASRALTDCQKKYAQIEKELLAIVFGCDKFHDYIYGRTVVVETDHKPLEQIFQKPLHQSPLRLQKMLLKLQKYSLKVIYKKGSELYLADQLSRAYIPEEPKDALEEELEINVVLPVSDEKLQQLKEETQKDEVLKKLKNFVEVGWPNQRKDVDTTVAIYWDFKEYISVHDGLLFKGDRLIVPESMRNEMLKTIHQGHFGSEVSKRRARDVLFWPKMSQDIEDDVKKCEVCNAHKNHQRKEPLKPHTVPQRVWSKVGADLFEIDGKNYLLLVDYYSGFFELDYLSDTTAKSVITKMKSQIARYGIFEDLITDNGPQFTSREFKDFSLTYGFRHTTSSPGYPKSNGMAERAVQTAKSIIIKAKEDGTDPYLGLLNYRNTPRDAIVGSPAQRLLGRRTRTQLPTSESLLSFKPLNPADVQVRLEQYRKQQKKFYDRNARHLEVLKEGDVVRMKTDKGFQKRAIVKETLQQPRSYLVKSNGTLYRRNRNHLLKVNEEIKRTEETARNRCEEKQTENNSEDAEVCTRYGRIVKKPVRFTY